MHKFNVLPGGVSVHQLNKNQSAQAYTKQFYNTTIGGSNSSNGDETY